MAADCIQANLVGADNMGRRAHAQVPRVVAKGMIFTGVRPNADPESEAGIAVSL